MLTRGQRIEIIKAITYRVLAHTEYPTPSEYNAICQCLVTKYPKIKDVTGNGYVSYICICVMCVSILNEVQSYIFAIGYNILYLMF